MARMSSVSLRIGPRLGCFSFARLAMGAMVVPAALMFAASLADAASRELREDTPEIIVEGSRPAIKQRVDEFVSGITRHTSPPDTSLPRWRKPVCPLVAGLPREQGEFVLERISQAATSAEAPLGDRECQANLYVVVTSQPRELLQKWRKRDRHLFGGSLRPNFGGPGYRLDGPAPAAIDRFLESTQPIRVWYNTEYQDIHQRWQATHFEWGLVVDLSSVIVIVDANRIDGTTLEQVADYIAMVGLAKLNPGEDVGDAPTVLRLFGESNSAALRGMSDWDRAFLKALYQVSERSTLQRFGIKSRMVSDIAPR